MHPKETAIANKEVRWQRQVSQINEKLDLLRLDIAEIDRGCNLSQNRIAEFGDFQDTHIVESFQL